MYTLKLMSDEDNYSMQLLPHFMQKHEKVEQHIGPKYIDRSRDGEKNL